MNIDKVYKLMEKFESSSIVSFEYTEGDSSLKLKKAEGVPGNTASPMPMPIVMPAAPMQAAGAAAPVAPQVAPENISAPKEEGKTINSPIVGTFYAASAPDNPPYVSVGSKVSAGDTVCMIEAMKMMSEVVSDVSGVVAEILVENGQMVEFGQPLFRIKE